ncbi:MAG: DUF421 domain-containing protein [bacterium]|nr:DUF421 domain-containing protein [bacterium]
MPGSIWSEIFRVVVNCMLAYVGLIIIQRVTGKRTLSKMNAFDLIVTVALGSGLATIILSREVSLIEGLLALILLMGFQYAITWLSVRFTIVNKLVKSEPRLLLYNGELQYDAMRLERVVEEEILQALRASGKWSLQEVAAVVLETDGSFSVIGKSEGAPPSALTDVRDANNDAVTGKLT